MRIQLVYSQYKGWSIIVDDFFDDDKTEAQTEKEVISFFKFINKEMQRKCEIRIDMDRILVKKN